VLCKDKEIARAGALITANPQGFYVRKTKELLRGGEMEKAAV